MKQFVILLVSILFGFLVILNYFIWKPAEVVESKSLPSVTPTYSLNPKALVETPPGLSQEGIITKLTGNVMFEARGESEYSPITEPQAVHQGDQISTAENSTVNISFGENSTISISENSELFIIQSLMNQFVLSQQTGSITYTNNTDSPFTVRSNAMIVELNNGSMKIVQDEENETIRITLQKGTAEIAYNNATYVSQRVSIQEGDVFLFDIDKRKGKIL